MPSYNAISVTELNKYIKDKIDKDEMLNNVFVKGEISNYKHHYTGHLYFTLKVPFLEVFLFLKEMEFIRYM